jgi:ribosomal protein S18 acetylase RimI-like enzyme
VEELGPLRLFVADGVPWSYYARPSGGVVTEADVRAVRARQWELGAPEALEWIADLAPSVAPAARAAGLVVREAPLLALGELLEPAAPRVARVRRLAPDDPALAASRAVTDLAFSGGGGPAERDAARSGWPEHRLGAVRERIAAGLLVTMVAESRSGGVIATGSHLPHGDTTEIVGVATLPALQRRGLGAAITAALAADARRRGAALVFLSAGTDAGARLYGRLGFGRVGTAGLGAPPVSS